MFRDIFSSSRALLVGFVFFVLVVGGSLLYSWHVHRTTDAELARTDAVLQHVNRNETRAAEDTVDTSIVDFEQAGTDLETDDAQRSDGTGALPIDDTSEVLDLSDAFLPDDLVSEEELAEDMPVSPYGFGLYPEVPDGFPENFRPVWTWSEEKRQDFSGSFRDMELIHRVLIKLWNQGERGFVGATRSDSNGKVYPLYRNRIYVTRWIEVPVEGGTLMPFPAGGLSGGSDWKPDIETFVKSGGKLPGHIQFIDRDTAGYNPYDFLNLR